MPLFKKNKSEEDLSDEELASINEIAVESGSNRVSLAMLLTRAREIVENRDFKNLIDIYNHSIIIELKDIENLIVNKAMRLMVLNLLEDIDEDYYVEQMENLKEKLKILRKIEKKFQSYENNQKIVYIETSDSIKRES